MAKIGINAIDLVTQAGFSKAGIARYASELLPPLCQLLKGHEVHIYLPKDAEDLGWSASNTHFHRASGILAARKTLWGMYATPGVIRRAKYDIWFSLAHTLPVHTRAKTILTVHDIFPFTHPEWVIASFAKKVQAALRPAILKANHLIAVSEATKADVHSYFKRDRHDITVTHLATADHLIPSPDVKADLLNQSELQSGKYFLALSTLEPRKNLSNLIDAFGKLAGKSSEWRLAVIGAKGWKTTPIFDKIKALGLEDRVVFLGYVADEDLPCYFAGCRAFVCASFSEGFGIPVLEAMKLGAPVLTSNGGSLPEVASDAAMFFDPYDVNSIEESLIAATSDNWNRSDFIKRGLTRASEFAWQKTAEQTAKIIEALVA